MARNIGDNIESCIKTFFVIAIIVTVLMTVSVTMLLTAKMGEHPQPNPPAGYVAG